MEEIKKSKKMSSQPLLWKQASINFNKRGWNISSIVVFFIPIKNLFELMDNPSIMVDYLVIGSNPILNILILEEISKKCYEKHEHKSVAVFCPNQPDYWNYELINDDTFWREISKKRNKNIKNIKELFQDICFNLQKEYLEILLVKEDNMFVKYAQYDKYVDGWVFHLFEKDEKENKLKLDPYIEMQNDIKSIIKEEFLKNMFKFKLIKKIKWENLTEKNYPVILTKKVHLTSLPQGWINSSFNSNEDLIIFKNDLSLCSYGSAVHIMTNKQKLKEISKEDIVNFTLKDCV